MPMTAALCTSDLAHATVIDISNTLLPPTNVAGIVILNELTNLHLRNISHSRHSTVHSVIDGLSVMRFLKSQVKHLVLSLNYIQHVDSRFLNVFPKLEYIDLSRNLIAHLKFINLRNHPLKTIILDYNYFTSFPSVVLDLPNLETLSLRDNDYIENFVYNGQRNSLRSFDISHSDKLKCSCELKQFVYTIMAEENDYDIKGKCDGNINILQINLALCNGELQMSPFRMANAVNFTSGEGTLNAIRHRQNSVPFDLLRPTYGTGFSYLGQILPSTEQYFIHFHITIPDFVLPPAYDVRDMQNLCNGVTHTIIKKICEDFIPLLTNMAVRIKVYHKNLEQKFKELEIMLRPSFLNKKGLENEHNRQKRESEFRINSERWNTDRKRVLGLMVNPIAAFYASEQLTHRRFEVLEAILTAMVKRQNLFSSEFMDIRQSLASSIDLVSDQFTNTTTAIKIIYAQMRKAEQLFNDNMNMLTATIDQLEKRLIGTRILSILSSRYLYLCNVHANQLQQLLKEADFLIQALNDLTKNQISPFLLPPSQIEKAIEHAQKKLSSWHKSMKIAFTSPAFVMQNSVVFASPFKKGILLQLTLPIYAKNSQAYRLYSTKTIHVPVNTETITEHDNADYTKIKLTHDYIAVSSQSYMLLTESDLKRCSKFSETFYCEKSLLQIDIKTKSCLSTLFYNAEPESIAELCDIEYFPAPFEPKPSIIDAGQNVLLANLKSPFVKLCNSDNMARSISASRYGLVTHASLCACSLTAANAYVGQRISHCPKNPQEQIVFKYLLNSAAISIFKDVQPLPKLNLTSIYTMPMNITLPKLNLKHNKENDALIDNMGKPIKLQKLAKVIREKADIFLTKDQKLFDEIQFLNWWSPGSWQFPFAISFSMSIIGVVAMILLIILCCKYNNTQKIMSALTLSSYIPASRAETFPPDVTNKAVDLTLKAYSIISLSHVLVVIAIFLFIYLFKRLVTYLSRENYLNFHHPSLNQFPKCHLYLECHNGCEGVYIYLLTVRAHVSKISFSGKLNCMAISFQYFKLFGIMNIDWKQMDASLSIKDVTIPLPQVVKLPMAKTKKIKSITKENFGFKLYLFDGTHLFDLPSKHDITELKSGEGAYSALVRELEKRHLEHRDTNGIDSVTSDIEV